VSFDVNAELQAVTGTCCVIGVIGYDNVLCGSILVNTDGCGFGICSV